MGIIGEETLKEIRKAGEAVSEEVNCMDERVEMMRRLENEEQLYYRVIQKKLSELFSWDMSTDEIEDFLEAVRNADVEMGASG